MVVIGHCFLTESDGHLSIIDVEGCETTLSLKLQDILAFGTGANAVPPMGFSPEPTISFHSASLLPKANTCSNTIYLPTETISYSTFTYNMAFGIANSAGFGQV